MKPTYGTVLLKDWMLNPFKGDKVLAIRGKVDIVNATDVAGFKLEMGGNSADWAARITDGKRTLFVLGCQVRAFMVHGKDALSPVDTLALC